MSNRNAMTLVEVVAALMLAATVLGAALTAYGRAVRQERLATDRLKAVQAADGLLAEWFEVGGRPPLPDPRRQESIEGDVEGHDTWLWRVTASPDPAAARPTAERPFIVRSYRLEIRAKAPQDRSERPIVAVDFVGSITPVDVEQIAGAWR